MPTGYNSSALGILLFSHLPESNIPGLKNAFVGCQKSPTRQ